MHIVVAPSFSENIIWNFCFHFAYQQKLDGTDNHSNKNSHTPYISKKQTWKTEVIESFVSFNIYIPKTRTGWRNLDGIISAKENSQMQQWEEANGSLELRFGQQCAMLTNN